MSPIIIIIAALVAFSFLVFIFIFNSIKGKRNEIENATGGIDTYLKQRYDLIPNLVQAVKKYMEHEKSLLENVTKLRTQAMSANPKSDDIAQINNEISKMLGGIMVSVENYPDLKSNTNFIDLQKTLKEVEENIAASRRYYNSAVTDFNNSLDMFPSNIVAAMMGMKRRAVLKLLSMKKRT
jgi:LemA protein